MIEIFTDGSCLRNPGPGGYGVILHFRGYEKIFSSGFYYTTNNRMEIMAAIVALEALTKPCTVILNTDSQYLHKGVTNWIHNWQNHEWKTTNKKLIKNADLWQQLSVVINRHQIKWKWVKGHSGYAKNERCDKLARAAASNPLFNDKGYCK